MRDQGPAIAPSWGPAIVRAATVFAYFSLATVALPSWVLGLDAVASSTGWLRDAIAVFTWGVTLAVGIGGLRLSQREGWL